MGAVVVLTPVLVQAAVASWPLLARAVTSAATAAGFRKTERQRSALKGLTIDLEVENDNIDAVAGSIPRDDQIVVERQGVSVTFSRNTRGQFSTCVHGNLPAEELQKVGRALCGRVIQQYVYQRLSQELQNQGFVTVEENTGPDESIRLTVRKYEA